PATPAIADFRLDNGMRVLVAPTDGLPLVSARLNFDAGSANDPVGKPGVASMTAALLTQGAGGRSAPEIATALEQLGAEIGAGSGPDFTNVYANAPKDVFDETLAVMADVVRNPAFAAEELERQQSQTLDGLRVALSQPGAVAGQSVRRVIYGDAPYAAPGGGTPNSVRAVTRDDVAAFHAALYRRSQATRVFSGDIDEADARALAEQAFGDWRETAGATPTVGDKAGPALPPRVVVIDQPGAGQA